MTKYMLMVISDVFLAAGNYEVGLPTLNFSIPGCEAGKAKA